MIHREKVYYYPFCPCVCARAFPNPNQPTNKQTPQRPCTPTKQQHTQPTIQQQVSHLEGKTFDPESTLIKAYANEVVATIRDLVKVNPLFKEHFNFYTQKVDVQDPFKLADFAATLSTADGAELQEVNACLLEELKGPCCCSHHLIIIHI